MIQKDRVIQLLEEVKTSSLDGKGGIDFLAGRLSNMDPSSIDRLVESKSEYEQVLEEFSGRRLSWMTRRAIVRRLEQGGFLSDGPVPFEAGEDLYRGIKMSEQIRDENMRRGPYASEIEGLSFSICCGLGIEIEGVDAPACPTSSSTPAPVANDQQAFRNDIEMALTLIDSKSGTEAIPSDLFGDLKRCGYIVELGAREQALLTLLADAVPIHARNKHACLESEKIHHDQAGKFQARLEGTWMELLASEKTRDEATSRATLHETVAGLCVGLAELNQKCLLIGQLSEAVLRDYVKIGTTYVRLTEEGKERIQRISKP